MDAIEKWYGMAELRKTENKGRPFWRMETGNKDEAEQMFELAKQEQVGCRIIYTGNTNDIHYLGRYEDGSKNAKVIYGQWTAEQFLEGQDGLDEMVSKLGVATCRNYVYAQYIIDGDQAATRVSGGGKLNAKLANMLEGLYTMWQTGRISEAEFRQYGGPDVTKFLETKNKN